MPLSHRYVNNIVNINNIERLIIKVNEVNGLIRVYCHRPDDYYIY
jgi:hypothetical protein